MKRIALCLLLLFLSPYSLFGICCNADCEREKNWTLEVRGAYYQPSSRAIKRVYTNHFLDYQIEAAKRVWQYSELWLGVSWAQKHGRTSVTYGYDDILFRNSTKIYIVPISFGAKLIYPIFPCIDIYAGAGLCYTFMKIKNFCKEHYSYWGLYQSPFRRYIYKNDWGAIFKVGLQYALGDNTFLDIFVDYFSQRFQFSHHEDKSGRSVFRRELDCSGFKYGAGLGVYF